MKTFLTLLFATFLSISAFAYGEGRLTITLATKNSQVLVDGRTYLAGSDNTIVIDNLRPGNHNVRIYDTRKRRNGRNDRNTRNERSGDLIYSGTIHLKSFQHVDIMVNRFGKALVDERDLRKNDDSWSDDFDDPYGNYRVIRDVEFNQLVGNIKSKWFSSQKLETARQGMQNEYFRTAQVRELLQLFSTDTDKLELAKLAFDKTVDKNRYYTLYDLFSFQSSRDELDQYIRNRR